jgi:hypothetical protein
MRLLGESRLPSRFVEFLIGPDTGELAAWDGSWLRVDASELGIAVPGLFVDESELPGARRLGLVTAAENPSGEWRPLTAAVVDVSSRYEVDVYAISSDADRLNLKPGDLVKIAGAVFPDPHPESWWTAVHDTAGRIFVAVGPLKRHLRPDGTVASDFKRDARVGLFCLLVRAYDSGIGTRPQ